MHYWHTLTCEKISSGLVNRIRTLSVFICLLQVFQAQVIITPARTTVSINGEYCCFYGIFFCQRWCGMCEMTFCLSVVLTPLLTSQPTMSRARCSASSVPSRTRPKPPLITSPQPTPPPLCKATHVAPLNESPMQFCTAMSANHVSMMKAAYDQTTNQTVTNRKSSG